MPELHVILSLSGTILGLLITIATLLLKVIKNTQARKFCEQSLKIANAVLPFIQEAEQLVNYTGAEKKAYVMTKANQFAISNKMKFDETQVSQKVEELVQLTKQVNERESRTKQLVTTNQKQKTEEWL